MGLFRRRRKDADEPAPPATPARPPPRPATQPLARPAARPDARAPARPDAATSTGPPPSPAAVRPVVKPTDSASRGTLPVVPEPALTPPPLPVRLPEPQAEVRVHRGTYATCFVCGSALEHGACPKCRMTWVE